MLPSGLYYGFLIQNICDLFSAFVFVYAIFKINIIFQFFKLSIACEMWRQYVYDKSNAMNYVFCVTDTMMKLFSSSWECLVVEMSTSQSVLLSSCVYSSHTEYVEL